MHLLAPVFRESLSRDAYVLRGVGHRFGPVLRPKQTDRNAQLPPAG